MQWLFLIVIGGIVKKVLKKQRFICLD